MFRWGRKKDKAPEIVQDLPQPSTRAKVKNCGHNFCTLDSVDTCCACGDRRSHETYYTKYVDGQGYVNTAHRHEFYCPKCKEIWSKNKYPQLQVRPPALNPAYVANIPAPVPPRNQGPIVPLHAATSSNNAHYRVDDGPGCPHRSIQTDCRICNSEGESEQALRAAAAMGFPMQFALKAMSKLNVSEYRDANHLLSALVEEVIILQQQQLQQPLPPTPAQHPQPPPIPQRSSQLQLHVQRFRLQQLQQQQQQVQPADKDELENLCKICFANDINAVMIPCGHLALCIGCAQSVKTSKSPLCPLCRVQITTVVQTYKA